MLLDGLGTKMVRAIAAALLAEREEATKRERERWTKAHADATATEQAAAESFAGRNPYALGDLLRTPSEQQAVRKAIKEGKDG